MVGRGGRGPPWAIRGPWGAVVGEDFGGGWRCHLELVSLHLARVHGDSLVGLPADVVQRGHRIALQPKLLLHGAQLELGVLGALPQPLHLVVNLPQINACDPHVLRDLCTLFFEPGGLIV